jgi:O-antigen/teichoic acid export membrane protein
MNRSRRIAINTIGLFLMTVAVKFFAFLLVIKIARGLGPAGLGQYSFLINLAILLALFSDMGLSTMSIRTFARERRSIRDSTLNLLSIKLVLSVIVFGFTLVFIRVYRSDSPPIIAATTWFILSAILDSFSIFIRSIFDSQEKMLYRSVIETIHQGSTVSLCLVLLAMGHGVIALSYAFFAVSAAIFLVWIVCYLRVFGWPFAIIHPRMWKGIVLAGVPFAFYTIFNMIQYRIDILLIPKLSPHGDEAVGFYNAGGTILSVILTFSFVFVNAIYPVFCSLHNDPQGRLKKFYAKATHYLLFIGIPISVGGVCLAREIILLIYKSEYVPAIVPFAWLICSAPLVFYYTVADVLLKAAGKERLCLLYIILGSLVNVVLNVILIPRFDILGACWATIACKMVMAACYLYTTMRFFQGFQLAGPVLKSLAASAIMAVFIILFRDILPFAATLGLAVVIYGVCGLIMGMFTKEDGEVLRNILTRPREQN